MGVDKSTTATRKVSYPTGNADVANPNLVHSIKFRRHKIKPPAGITIRPAGLKITPVSSQRFFESYS
jgi:hypothetical protein